MEDRQYNGQKKKGEKRTKHFTENLKIKQQKSYSKSDVNWNAPRGYAVPAPPVTPVMSYMVKEAGNNLYSVISWNGKEWRDFDDENVFDFHLTCQHRTDMEFCSTSGTRRVTVERHDCHPDMEIVLDKEIQHLSYGDTEELELT